MNAIHCEFGLSESGSRRRPNGDIVGVQASYQEKLHHVLGRSSSYAQRTNEILKLSKSSARDGKLDTEEMCTKACEILKLCGEARDWADEIYSHPSLSSLMLQRPRCSTTTPLN